MSEFKQIGIIGAGTMGSGIAQVASTAGHEVLLYDNNQAGLEKSIGKLHSLFDKLVSKEKYTREEADGILGRIQPIGSLAEMEDCNLVIEAIVEDFEIKQQVFNQIETFVSD